MAFCASFLVRSRSRATQRALARCGRAPRRSPSALELCARPRQAPQGSHPWRWSRKPREGSRWARHLPPWAARLRWAVTSNRRRPGAARCGRSRAAAARQRVVPLSDRRRRVWMRVRPATLRALSSDAVWASRHGCWGLCADAGHGWWIQWICIHDCSIGGQFFLVAIGFGVTAGPALASSLRGSLL